MISTLQGLGELMQDVDLQADHPILVKGKLSAYFHSNENLENYSEMCKHFAVSEFRQAEELLDRQNEELRQSIAQGTITAPEKKRIGRALAKAKSVLCDVRSTLNHLGARALVRPRPCVCGGTHAKNCPKKRCKACCDGCDIHPPKVDQDAWSHQSHSLKFVL